VPLADGDDQMLALVEQDLSNELMSGRPGLTEKIVKGHATTIMEKL
jgi:hypothetical protein